MDAQGFIIAVKPILFYRKSVYVGVSKVVDF